MMTNELPFHTEGDAAKPSLVLIHDLFGSNTTWLPLKAVLLEQYQLVFVELWGHGLGAMPEQVGAFSPDSYIEELEIIRHIIGTPSWAVCGLGYGAGIAMQYALKKPKNIQRVIVSEISPFFDARIDINKQRILHELRGSLPLSNLSQHPANFEIQDELLKHKLLKQADEVNVTSLLGAFSYIDELSLVGAYKQFAMPLVHFCSVTDVLLCRRLADLAPQLSLHTFDANAPVFIVASDTVLDSLAAV